MKKIFTLFFVYIAIFGMNAQVILIQENFQDWTAQGTSGTYTITKKLADGVTDGTFSSDKLIVSPTQSIGGAGSAPGNGSPSVGRVVIGSSNGYLELPMLPTIGQIEIKANIGTDLRQMKLQVKNGAIFEDIPNTVTEINKDVTKLYTFNLTYSEPATIRIVTTNSSLNIWDLKVSSYVSSLPQLPNTPVVNAATSVSAETFVASWTPVADAVGYFIKVYSGTDLIVTKEVTGQPANSAEVRGLLTNTAHTYTVTAKGDGINNSNSAESSPSASFTTLEGLISIETDFSDGTWGTLYTSEDAPTVSGTYPSSYENNFDISNAFLYNIVRYDSRGDRKENGIRMDRQSFGGKFILPVVRTVEQIEIHAIPGGAPRDLVLKELVNGAWVNIGTYTLTTSTDYKEFIIPISRTTPTKFSIENAGSGQITLYQVIARPTNPTLLTPPAIGEASDVTESSFTAKWSAVTHATGYVIRVYQGTTLVNTYEVSGQSSDSQLISNLEPETEYTYRVYAVGDGFVDFSDSYLSDASLMVKTNIPTGLSTTESNAKIRINGKTIISSEVGSIHIYSIQGAQISIFEQVKQVETTLSKGVYLVKFIDSKGLSTNKKVIIQ